MMTSANRPLLFMLIAIIIALAVSGWRPYDRITWLMEVAPVLIALPILIWTRDSYRLTMLVYLLIFLHALVLILGGAYTYARVPPGFWVQDVLGLARNPYDKLGHFMQGFVPAMIAREILLRNRVVNGRRWLFFIICCVALAISALYEFLEWWVAVASGTAAEAFLATQGDVWDTQWDMFLALCGAVSAQLLLNRWHDAQLARMSPL
jgi:putative membrane protein